MASIPITGIAHVGIRVHDLERAMAFYSVCPDLLAAKASLAAVGFPVREGPVRFTPHAEGMFVRDPDGNVIELHQRSP